jgi:hypothetical protein
VLTNTNGDGELSAQWQPLPSAPPAYANEITTNSLIGGNNSILNHGAGEGQSDVTYFASFTAELTAPLETSPSEVECWLTDSNFSQKYNPVTVTIDSASSEVSMATQGLITDPNGNGIYVGCSSTAPNYTVQVPTSALTLLVENSPNGDIGS